METVLHYIFISPHLDDAILSCGGIIHSLNSSGQNVEIWTVFAGKPKNFLFNDFTKSLHQRWALDDQFAITNRLKEDKTACKILGVKAKYFRFLDCIYRFDENGKHLVNKEEDLFQDVKGNQIQLIKKITKSILEKLSGDAILISPFAIGKHIDHQIVKMALQNDKIKNLMFYADFPYVVKESAIYDPSMLNNLAEVNIFLKEIDLEKWKLSVSAYRSQISTFWNGNREMFQKIDDYVSSGGGKKLWKKQVLN